jgi:amino-acid N-acetyltransferase
VTDEITIVPAAASDVAEIEALLSSNGLSTEGVDQHWRTFVVARDGSSLVGCGGAEAYRSSALIRSIAVAPEYRSRGLVRQLVRQLLDRLSARGLRDFYLFTTDASAYFARRGFSPIDRENASLEVKGSTQFQGACPERAVCMRLLMLG